MAGAGLLVVLPPDAAAPNASAKDASSSPSPDDASVAPSAPAASPLFLYVLTCCSTIGGFLFGYDTGVISGALVLLKSPQVFDLSDLQSESVVSAAVFGAIVGAALASCGTHALGRRPVILASSLLFTLGSALMGAAPSFAALLVGRLVVGVGIGLSSMSVPLYIAEVSPPQIRGRLVSLNTLLVTGGQFFACLLDAVLSAVPDGWRYMLGLAAIPAAVQVVGFLLLPESPRFLISKGRKEAAWKALVQIRGTESVEHEYNAIESELLHKQDGGDGAEVTKVALWAELRKPTVARALVLGCGLQALQQLCGINTVMYYGATIIQMAGFNDPSTAIWLSAVVSFSNFIFTFVGIYLVDHAGRRVLTLASLAGVIASLGALGASFYAAHRNSTRVVGAGVCSALTTCFDCVANAQCGFCAAGQGVLSGLGASSTCVPGDAFAAAVSANGVSSCPTTTSTSQWFYSSCPSDNPLAGWLILVSLFVYLACFASGMGSTPWTINAEIYPLRVRSFALSAATSVNWVANLLVSFTFLSIINAFSAYGAFWFYGAIASVGFVFLYFELPETKGLELEEIQQMFERRHTYATLEKE